jgi:hypothetical protein
MSELDDAMKEHMAYLVLVEHSTFSYKDFRNFEVNQKSYRMSHGTFRNKIREMIQKDEVEVHTKSNPNFYTLKGCRFDNEKPMTSNHTEVITTQKLIRHPLYLILEDAVFGERAVHNFHVTFKAEGIYDILSNNPQLIKGINKHNKGIKFNYCNVDKFSIILSVYPTNTCQIVIGCSENPILLNFEGVNKLTTTLCRIEERLSYLCSGSFLKIPNYKYWIITLWHIGKDSISEYSGKMFHCEWGLAEEMILRIYSKKIENKKKVRIEIQQNPSIPIEKLLIKLGIEKILE